MKVSDVGRYYEDFFEDFDMKYFQDLIGKFGLEEGMKQKTCPPV